MEQRRAVAAHEGSAQGEGLAAGVCEDARRDALGRAAPLVFVNFVRYQQVEEAPHVVLHVVRERIPLRAGLVGLPEGGAAVGADVPSAVQVGVGQGNPVLVRDLRRAVGAAGDPERLPRLLLPHQPALRRCPPLDDGGLPSVGELGPFPAHHREEGAGADGEPEPLQVRDGLDDGGACAGHRLLHLPFPLGDQVRRAEHQDALEARHVRRRRADKRLARAHLAHHRRSPVGFEGEGRALYGVPLRPQGGAEQAGKRAAVLRGPVERRVGLHHPLGDGLLVGVDELSEVHVVSPSLCRVWVCQNGARHRGLVGCGSMASRLSGLREALPPPVLLVAAAPQVVRLHR